MYEHLHDALSYLGFFGEKSSDVVMRRLKGLFNRANVTQRELSIVRGICSAIQGKKLNRSANERKYLKNNIQFYLRVFAFICGKK